MSLDYTAPFGLGLAFALVSLVSLLVIALRRVLGIILRRRWRPLRRASLASLSLMAIGAASMKGSALFKGATLSHAATDLVMTQAPRPPPDWRRTAIPPYVVLAGDLHCHINPPDWSDHVARHLPETIALARAEGLDFVSLVPHVFTDFYADPEQRPRVVSLLEELRARVAARPDDGLIVDVGVEYIDPTGHVGMVFGDVPGALAATPLELAKARPGAFFDAFADRGGLLIVNHPLLTPTHRGLPLASLDISWQPFTGTPPFRPEIEAVDRWADGFEAANLFVGAFRDRLLRGDADESTRHVLARLDREILARGRRMTPVGGTDSHSFHLRPMTFVLARERSHAGIREGIRAGRTCVLQPAACTFEVRGDGAFAPVGSSIDGPARHRVEVRARGRAIAVYRNGEKVATPADGEVVAIEVTPSACTVLRATVDGGYSAPVYVDCPFAKR
ncbi:Hypothetical protein A7982_06078 [Minicystis rosea]|nr:Hypothetical protein A7982_06078 [Minicystis rosea]